MFFSLYSLLPGEAQSGDGSGLGISVAHFPKQTKHLTISWRCDALPKSDCAFFSGIAGEFLSLIILLSWV